jgi:thiamine pyrophosphokinase
MSTVILANGRFPTHNVPLSILNSASNIICCDGAVNNLDRYGLEPTAIVGDLDSLSEDLRVKYSYRLFHDSDQQSNDLTKTVKWCIERGIKALNILAGTGLREDHTLGNIGLLPSYTRMGIEVKMITDYGTLVPLLKGERLTSFKGQKVSIFSFENSTVFRSKNLMYPIEGMKFNELWEGTLNQSLDDWFELIFETGSVVVFRAH